MKAKLVIVSPEVTPNEFELKLPTKIGRGHDAKLKLVHPLISRLHCEFFQDGDDLKIRDLDSLNGTFVNQERITGDTVLTSGATVMIGSVMARVQIGDDADRLPPPKSSTQTTGMIDTVRTARGADAAPGAQPAEEENPWADPLSGDESEDGLLDLDFDDEPAQPAAPSTAAAGAQNQQTMPGVVIPQGGLAPSGNEPPTVPVPAPVQAAKPAAPAPKPAAPAPQAPQPAPAASEDDDVPFHMMPEEPAEGQPSGESTGDEDMDDFFKSIM